MRQSEEEREFLADLRSLGQLHRQYLESGLPQRRLARHLQVSPTTIGSWLRGHRIPQQQDTLASLVTLLHGEADRLGVVMPPAEGRLLEAQTWRSRHQRIMRRRADTSGEQVQAAQALMRLREQEARARYAALQDTPRSLEKWTPQQLGVHPAIRRIATNEKDMFVLPGYVERRHDRLLRQHLATAAADETTVLVVLRGASCTGKTRTAYEAVRACLPEWDLVFPKTAESLLALLAIGPLPAHTVLWLNEAQNYLIGATGEASAAALRTQLEHSGPVVIIATLWPNYHRDLTETPAGAEDYHPHARALLSSVHPVDVPVAFTSQDLGTLRTVAHDSRDSSLSTAARTSPHGAVAQTLAAGPQLVDHYEQAELPPECFGKAVITAAMDAHRLGWAAPLTAEFLKAAAPGYLTDGQRTHATPDWFTQAVSFARTKIKGVASALEQVPCSSGMGALPDQFHLADYLAHHGRSTRWDLCPPAAFWDAAGKHLPPIADLSTLARAAESRGRYRIAAALAQRAAAADDPHGLYLLARAFDRSGDLIRAEELYQRAADHGSTRALLGWAMIREENGDLASAEQLAQRAAAAGYVLPVQRLAVHREKNGDRDSAERLARWAMEAGNGNAWSSLVGIRSKSGDMQGAERAAKAMADAGSPYRLADLWLRRRQSEDLERVEQLLAPLVGTGEARALMSLARQRQAAGDLDDAIRLVQQAADQGNRAARHNLALLYGEAGDNEGALQLYRQLAELGDIDAWTNLVRLAEESGDHESAERLAREAADAGIPYGLSVLAGMRHKAGHQQLAEEMFRQAHSAGIDRNNMLTGLALRYRREGNLKEAERLAREAVDSGDPQALRLVAELREEAGDRVSAEQLMRHGLDADGSIAST
ncbi:tetratricopeptide repeat protein [Streptomyces sp. 2314.4]|uniref:tetratricopeptide repeat protein n=1 Tax=Streptomyces sp. 2314.4 TaxID=1881025 RepID=UPI0008957453|nr:tetratricopeptide repeat protein [Streptomyces sp. 2314.4]SEC13907.1 TPR repeat [Streptomyces sp. 2314.4]